MQTQEANALVHVVADSKLTSRKVNLCVDLHGHLADLPRTTHTANESESYACSSQTQLQLGLGLEFLRD